MNRGYNVLESREAIKLCIHNNKEWHIKNGTMNGWSKTTGHPDDSISVKRGFDSRI
jgi:hypothetical protein